MWWSFLGWFLKPKNLLVVCACGMALFLFLRMAYLKNVISSQNVKIVKIEKNALDLEYKYDYLKIANKELEQYRLDREKNIKSLQLLLGKQQDIITDGQKDCDIRIKLIQDLYKNCNGSQGDKDDQDIINYLNDKLPA